RRGAASVATGAIVESYDAQGSLAWRRDAAALGLSTTASGVLDLVVGADGRVVVLAQSEDIVGTAGDVACCFELLGLDADGTVRWSEALAGDPGDRFAPAPELAIGADEIVVVAMRGDAADHLLRRSLAGESIGDAVSLGSGALGRGLAVLPDGGGDMLVVDDELRRITAGGEIVWTSPLASGAVESPTIGVGADGVYVAVRGDEASSRWLRALSHAGAVRWTVALDASVRVEALAELADGLVLATGWRLAPGSDTDLDVASFAFEAVDGAEAWRRIESGPSVARGRALAAAQDGGFYLAGVFDDDTEAPLGFLHRFADLGAAPTP
ncbi:MAG: PQQ-binding-like beta-propeller repeat protein, partial [Myxococcales bacterium]|nr:PQQ-binding-like beta-propeller repeat protein [Myxococcales bacterium]